MDRRLIVGVPNVRSIGHDATKRVVKVLPLWTLFCSRIIQILEQDMALICAQEDHVARTGQPLSESFLPLKSSDTMVVELRKWLDHVGHGMPHFTGWKKLKASERCRNQKKCRPCSIFVDRVSIDWRYSSTPGVFAAQQHPCPSYRLRTWLHCSEL